MENKQINLAFYAFAISNVMVGLDGTIVATIMPSLMADLHGMTYMSWVVASYFLMMASSTPIWTKMGERFGLKKMFLIGTVIYILTSFVQGISPNIFVFILARAFMGIGAGGMLQLPFVIFGKYLKGAERRAAFGRATTSYAIASAIGPFVGGWISQNFGWEWTFYINIPIGILMYVLVNHNFNSKFDSSTEKIDFIGSGLIVLLVSSLLMGLQLLGEVNSSMTLVVLLFAFSAILLALFVVFENKNVEPILPLRLFRNLSFSMKQIVAFVEFGFFYGYMTYFPIWSQGVLGKTATVGGLIMVPGSVAIALGSAFSKKIINRIGEKNSVSLSLLTMLIGTVIILTLGMNNSVISLTISGIIIGFANGLFFSIQQSATQDAVKQRDIGPATSLNSLFRTIGSTVFLSIFSLTLNTRFYESVERSHNQVTMDFFNKISDVQAAKSIPNEFLPLLRNTLYDGLHGVVVMMAILMIVAIIINQWLDPWKTNN
ncbi:MFS transporter [Leuconostoc pseudomesenteroides]|uniref:MFS transporter n=1 Tax=Leuconostoc pseudomesenteroides TaxID=33968 RepID=UPI00301C9B64